MKQKLLLPGLQPAVQASPAEKYGRSGGNFFGCNKKISRKPFITFVDMKLPDFSFNSGFARSTCRAVLQNPPGQGA